jgi:hypothetical protein
MDVTKARNCKPDAGVLAERAGNGDGITIATLPGCNPLCESELRLMPAC